MFQCPLCSKGGFKDEVAVAHHMNQPLSGCSTWLHDIIRLDSALTESMDVIDDELSTPNDSHHLANTYEDHNRSGGWDEDTGSGANLNEGGFTGSVNEEEISPTSDFIDWFPGASRSYGTGHTFLDLFNLDKNSMHHARNLYYPFSGQKDWELASWLLRLGLSMGKTDSFLSLEIVSTQYLQLVESNNVHDKIQGLPLSFSSAKEL